MSGSNEGFGSIGHLAVRFFGSLRPGGPPPADDAWAMAQLLPGEQELWVAMSGPDRRHAVGVARDAIALLAGDGAGTPPRAVVAAALLHDVGKITSGLGTWARAGVTVVAMVAGRDRVASWAPPPGGADHGAGPDGGRGRRSAAGAYVTHDRIGAHLLRTAGSDELTVAWAGEHHLPATAWTLERRLADALKAADGD
jgi:hypothetical protein